MDALCYGSQVKKESTSQLVKQMTHVVCRQFKRLQVHDLHGLGIAKPPADDCMIATKCIMPVQRLVHCCAAETSGTTSGSHADHWGIYQDHQNDEFQ